VNKKHVCLAMKRQNKRLLKSETESVFEITRWEGAWRASVPENDYTRQPITFCPYCGNKLSASDWNVDTP